MIAMFDAIFANEIPANATAAAGYAGGRWPDFAAIVARFPHLAAQQRVKSIAINDQEVAHVLDVERGDANPSQAPGWVKRMLAQPASVGIYKPAVYADRSTMPAVQQALDRAGLKRSQYMLWIADWTYTPHLPAGFEACQWTDKAGPDDESLCLDSFFPPLGTQASSGPKGVFKAEVQTNCRTGQHRIKGIPGDGVVLGGPDRWASAVWEFDSVTGEHKITPAEWNAPPLGG